METLVHLSWRLYLALPLMALGAAGAVWGAKRGLQGPLRPCTMMPPSWSLSWRVSGPRSSAWRWWALALPGSGISPGLSQSHWPSVVGRPWKRSSFSLHCGMGQT
jgi:hypothetical protein